MARRPLILYVGSPIEAGSSARDVTVVSGPGPTFTTGKASTAWHESYLAQAQYYNFQQRAAGVTKTINGVPTLLQRFPGAPGGDSYVPWCWNHDARLAFPLTASGVTLGATTRVQLNFGHARPNGATFKVLCESFGGTDAARFNVTHEAVVTGPNEIELVGLNSTGWTVTASGGQVRIPGLDVYINSPGARAITCDTDRMQGGSVGAPNDLEAVRGYGVPMPMMADAHELYGALGERVTLLEIPTISPILARPQLSVSAVTIGATTILQTGTHALPQEIGVPMPVVLWGFTGNFAPLNGLQSAYYVDSSRFEIRVDSSAWGSYSSGAKCVTRQRWNVETEYAWANMTRRIRDVVQALNEGGNTAELIGIVTSFGYLDIQRQVADLDAPRVGSYRVASVSTTGFPTTVTFLDNLPYSQGADGKALRLMRFTATNSSNLEGIQEVRITSPTTAVVHVSNVNPIGANAKASIGDPTYFLGDVVGPLHTKLREAACAYTGQTPEDVPMVILPTMSLSEDTWDGVERYNEPKAADLYRNAALVVADRTKKVAVLNPGTLRRSTVGSIPALQSVIDVGHKVFAELQALDQPIADVYPTKGGASYGFFGDSYGVGGDSGVEYAIASNDPAYDGTDYEQEVANGTRRIEMFNVVTGQFEAYTGVIKNGSIRLPGNSNTTLLELGQGADGSILPPGRTVGPDQSLLRDARKHHAPDTIYVFKFCVGGSNCTGGRAGYSVASIAADPADPNYALIELPLGTVHRRFDFTATYTVELVGSAGSGMSGLNDQEYTAQSTDLNKLRVHVGQTVSGSYSGGMTVKIPVWNWSKDANDLWPLLVAAKARFDAAMVARGLCPDFRGLFVPGLGMNDAQFGDPDAYPAKFAQLVADWRALLTTRSNPAQKLGISMSRVRSLPKASSTLQAAIAEIQAHQETYATTDTAFRLGSLDSPDDTDGELTEAPVSSGGIHLTAHGVLEQGHDLWNDFVTIDTSCAANPDLSSSSSSSSSSASASASSSGGSEAVSAVPGTFIPVE